MDCLADAKDEDYIFYSDNDEIPNLENINFETNKTKILIFEQRLFYYKFNLFCDLVDWYGTKGCLKKNLISFEWLRQIKPKKYPFYRFDTFFSKIKYTNVKIIDDGGWHFTNLKTPEELYKKMTNFGHYEEFELSRLTINDLRKKISDKKVFYNHFTDKSDQRKWEYDYRLKKIENDLLPEYLQYHQDKYKEWFD